MNLFKDNVRLNIMLALVLALSIVIPYFISQYIEKQIKADISNSLHTVVEATEQGLLLWVNEEKSLAKSWAINSEIVSHATALSKIPETR
ncbi:MAG: hypothetical protein ABUK13_06540, partial [Gammaproteobacteria bacterium]